jgi:phytol kinase
MMLCGGDGLADIIGRRFGKVKLPWNGSKSWAGSLGMLIVETLPIPDIDNISIAFVSLVLGHLLF